MKPNPEQSPATGGGTGFLRRKLHGLASILNRSTSKLGRAGKWILLLSFLLIACSYCGFLLLRTPVVSLNTGEIIKTYSIPRDTLSGSAPVSEQEYVQLRSYRLLLDSILDDTEDTKARLELEKKYHGLSDSIARLERIYHLQSKSIQQ